MELKVDHNSPVPLHAQVENMLRALIKEPPYRDGGLLPREVDLAKRLGISRNTLRQATNKLEYEGLLVRRKGIGTKVAGNDVVTRLQQWHSFTQEMNEQGVHFHNYELFTNWEKAGEKAGGFFQIPEDALVLKLSRLRGDDEGPFVFFESYFHPRTGLSENEDFTRPLYDVLEQDHHVVPSLSEERIKSRRATTITSKRLRIPKGEPVLVRERFVYDAGNRPIEYNRGIYRADKFTYSISIQR
ncbi:MAG: GntR family transcriptional regulator [Bacteroidota bacterium]